MAQDGDLVAVGVRDRMPAIGDPSPRDYVVVPRHAAFATSPPAHLVLGDTSYRLQDEGTDGWVARGLDLERDGRFLAEVVLTDGRELPVVVEVSTVQ